MVFESLVADLLNRFLGPYVENLDASQLKLGIWSGDVVLQNLFVKEGALDELDLPVKIKVGNIGKLTLKIPWKNIYSAPVVATLEGLYVVAAPNADIKYNAEKDKKQKFEAKQRTLQRVEDAKTKEKEKDKVKDPKADSFAEKLAMQVVKNVQVKVCDIHIRYEDRTTNPKAPFALGATLQNISLETTDENWVPCVVDQTVQLVHKMLRLDSLAVYFNAGSEMYTTKDRQELLDIMKSSIATEGKIPKGYQYLIEPISSQAQLRLNPKPESNLSVPQAYVNLVIQSIGVALRRKQYRDVMQLLGSFERMTRNEPFRKYKPDVPLRGHAKEWWHYAQNSIMEETVRRRHRMWSWAHISKHRKMMKEYIKLYVDKLDTSKPSKDLLKKLEDLERELDVFNITLGRQQAEVEFKKKGKKKKKDKGEGGGWFGGWWGGGKKEKKKKDAAEEDDLASIADKFQEAMTEEEKAKLYAAIGYSETSVNTTLPKDYVGVDANFKLLETSVKLIEDSDDDLQILNLAVTDLGAVFKQRPAAEAIKLDLQLGEFSVLGSPNNGQRPQMVESEVSLEDEKVPEVSLQFETNPMDGKADQRVTLRTQPLKVVYDAHTINSIAAFFIPPQDVRLDDLSAAAMSNLTELGSSSTTGLQFMVDNKQILDINVDVKSTYVIIPEKGVFDGSGSVLVVDLGNFKMTTESEERHVGDRTENESLEELLRKAYDRFNLDIKSVQVIFAPKGEDWQAIRKQNGSPLHLLQPMDLHISLQKCMVEDVRLAKTKVNGELPDVSITLSDHKLKQILALATSIPLPESDELEAPTVRKDTKGSAAAAAAGGGQAKGSQQGGSVTASVSVVKALASLEESDGYETASEWTESEAYSVSRDVSDRKLIAVAGDDSDDEFLSADEGSSPTLSKKKQAVQRQESTSVYMRSDVELNFELKKVALNLGQVEADGSESPVLGVAIHSLGAKVQVRPMDIDVEMSLGSIAAQHHKFQAPGSDKLYLVRTPAYDEKAERLLSVKYHKIDKNNPEFATTYESTEQMIKIHFTTLEVVAHCEAILDITDFADSLVASLDQGKAAAAPAEDGQVEDEGYISEDDKKPERKRTKPVKVTDVIDVKVVATLDTIGLAVCTKEASLTEVAVKGLEANVTVQKHKTCVNACLQEITVSDPTPEALHPRILATLDKEVFKMELTIFNHATVGDLYSDMNAVDMRVGLKVGCIRAVFLNKFVNNLLGFVDNFNRAKALAAEAGANAATAAQHAAEDINAKAQRIALDIVVKAPVIVIPSNSTSETGLLADLGQLSVKNSFSIVPESEKLENPAVIDSMHVALESIQLSRAIIQKEAVKSDVLILHPMGLHVNLARNLSAAWYHGAPAIAVSGKLEAIQISMATDDFGIVMSVLNENLQEGQPQSKPAPKAVQAGGDAPAAEAGAAEGEAPKDAATKETTAAEVTAGGKAEEEKPAEEAWIQVKADFEMEKIGVSLYTGTHDLTALDGRQERQAKNTLGHFAVCQLIVGATVMSDQAVEAKAKLGNILLNDVRSDNPNAITRMIYRYGEGDMNIVDVDFKMTAKKAIHLNAILRNLRACICTEFLVTCAEIFTKALPSDAATAQGTKSSTSVSSKPSSTSQAPPATPAPEEGTKNDMEIKAVLQNPEIILVADSSTMDTNALILQTRGEVNLIQSDGTMKMTGGLPMLRIDACPFQEDQRKGRTSKVLVPCNIDFHLSSPEGQGQRISVDLPELVLNVSPETVKILSAVAQTLSPSKAEAEEEKKKAADMSDVWDVKPLKTTDFWFLQQDEETDVDDLSQVLPQVPAVPPPQQVEELVANIKTIVVKIEAASGRRFVPMLILEASMHAVVKDWSSRLYVESHMKLEVSTYNEKVAAWEPLIESIEQPNEKYIPWSLSVTVVKNDDLLDAGSTTVSSEEEDSENVNLAPPAMTVTVSAEETLQMTVTKTSLALFNKLGQVFGQAMAEPTASLKDTDIIPACTVVNQTGVGITVKPGSYYEKPESGDKVSVKHTESINLDVCETVRASKKMALVNKSPISPSDMELSIQVEGYEELLRVPIVQAGSVLYNLQPLKKSSETVISITLEIKATLDMRTVIVRSPLQIFNHFDKPVDIYTRKSTYVEKLGEVQPNENFVVPLLVAHTQELLAKPVDDSHLMCDQPILYENLWKDRKAGGKKQVTFRCPAKVDGYTPFFFNVLIQEDTLLDVKGSSLHSPKYNIHLHPVVALRNLLPIPIYYTLQGSADEVKIEPCEQSKMFNVELAKTMMFVRIADYNDMEWRGEMTLRTTLQEYSQLGFRGPNNKWTEAGVWYDYSQGFIDMAMFVPYTLINKTGLPIAYKGGGEEQIDHPADREEPIFFSYPSKVFSPGKNKIQLKVGESQWSDKFSLDTVGSSGFISCKMSNKEYEAQGSGIRRPKKYNISVQIQLSNLGFSKVVMFTPRYLLVNQTNYDICCAEPNGTFQDVAVGQCVPFWPVDKKANDRLVVMKKGGTETSLPFDFTEPQTTVLRLPEVGGIIVESQVTETATVIAFRSFAVGHFTTQLVNHTQEVPITFTQFGVEDKMFLAPGETALYTWQNPTGKRQLIWTVDGKDSKNDLNKDGIGEVKQANKKMLYWVSFLNGTGRVILFTEDLAMATKAQQAAELEQPDLELVVSLPGIGLSLVNNISRTEVAYIGLISSGIIWQNKVRRRYKDLSVKEMKTLEEGFVKAGLDASDQKDLPPRVYKLDHGMEVDYGRMLMLSPKKQQLRRTYHSGVWAQVRTSSHQLQFHLTINRLQVDNQMPAAIFPTPVAPVPLPKTVAAESAPKQLLEFSMMVRFSEYSTVKQIKYLKLLVQEMAVKLDMGFLANVAAIFQSDEEQVIDRVALLELDKELVRSELSDAEYVKVALAKDFNFYDSFHLSPLKIHVSFSLSETGKEDKSLLSAQANARQNALNLLLQSVGVTLTNVDDVIFKLGFFEREYQFYSPEQLSSEVIRHYSNQAIKQLYVLVLGLDVIGNPFGFVRGVGTGVKDLFYEPYQGIVQGPEEFAEGVALGMRSLFGHAVGGAAGAVSRITGTLGKGLAALTMDEDYKRKRQQAINQRPATFQEGLARGGKGLVMGFYEGVSGVVKNPFEGAKKEGAKGFFKGVGKGLAGVVAKPTGGIIDFASGTFEGIRRVAESEVEIHKLREPRYIGADGIVRAYNKSMAVGNSLLRQVDKGKYAESDDYIAHLLVTADKKNYLLATDKRVIYASRGDMLGQWNVEFEFLYVNLKELPKLTEKGILIEPKEKEAPKGKSPLGKGFGRGLGSLIRGKQGPGKMVHILDQKTAEVFVSKLHFAIAKATNAV